MQRQCQKYSSKQEERQKLLLFCFCYSHSQKNKNNSTSITWDVMLDNKINVVGMGVCFFSFYRWGKLMKNNNSIFSRFATFDDTVCKINRGILNMNDANVTCH